MKFKPSSSKHTVNSQVDFAPESSKANQRGAVSPDAAIPNIGDRMIDKILRPALSGAIGALYLGYNYGFQMDYMLNKFGMIGGASLIADYLGNMVVDSSALKSIGLRRVENMVVEPVFAGVAYALLNQYYLGIKGKFLTDLMVGGGSDLAAGFVAAPLHRMWF